MVRRRQATPIRRLRALTVHRRRSATLIRGRVTLGPTAKGADLIGGVTVRGTVIATRAGAVIIGADLCAATGNPDLVPFCYSQSSGGINGNAALMLHRFMDCLSRATSHRVGDGVVRWSVSTRHGWRSKVHWTGDLDLQWGWIRGNDGQSRAALRFCAIRSSYQVRECAAKTICRRNSPEHRLCVRMDTVDQFGWRGW